MSKKTDAERAGAVAKLREWIKPGDTVYTVLRHVSKSGMSREIGIVMLPRANRTGTAGDSPLHPNYLVAEALGYRMGKRDGLIVGGCGMDMGFHIVYSLGRTLFPDGFGCIGKECRSNDHFNGDRNYTPHQPDAVIDRPSGNVHAAHIHWHKDGGYALRHNWL